MYDVGPLEQPALLLRRQAVLDVAIFQDLRQVATAAVLARDVRNDLFLRRAAREEEREGITKQARQPKHRDRLYSRAVPVSSDRGRFAERELHGVDDAGREERIVVWIERKPGAVWAVGRVVNPQLRNGNAAKAGDYVFEGYELEDALEQANAALEDDLTVSERDGRSEHCRPFTRDECLKPLEAWFFGRSA
jgi:hypothetical protein